MTVGERNPGFSQLCSSRLEEATGLGRGDFPSGSLQHGESTRAPCRRWFGRSLQPGVARIAAGPRRDSHRNTPGIFERGGEHASAALAEIIVAAAAIDP